MGIWAGSKFCRAVAPLAGAWIEIFLYLRLPSMLLVAPLAGAWIEIDSSSVKIESLNVAPLAGAWIEIVFQQALDASHLESLPSRERGLKSRASS